MTTIHTKHVPARCDFAASHQGQHIKQPGSTRRAFIQRGSVVAAASALGGVSLPWVHAGEDNTIRLGLIGCGGRGSGAVSDAFDSRFGPVKLFTMADLFENRLESALQVLKEKFGERVDVPPERRHIGFDAYRKVIDSLRPG